MSGQLSTWQIGDLCLWVSWPTGGGGGGRQPESGIGFKKNFFALQKCKYLGVNAELQALGWTEFQLKQIS